MDTFDDDDDEQQQQQQQQQQPQQQQPLTTKSKKKLSQFFSFLMTTSLENLDIYLGPREINGCRHFMEIFNCQRLPSRP